MAEVVTSASLMVGIVDVGGTLVVGISSRSREADHRHTLSPAEARAVADGLVVAASAIERGADLPGSLEAGASEEEIAAFIALQHPLEQLRGTG